MKITLGVITTALGGSVVAVAGTIGLWFPVARVMSEGRNDRDLIKNRSVAERPLQNHQSLNEPKIKDMKMEGN